MNVFNELPEHGKEPKLPTAPVSAPLVKQLQKFDEDFFPDISTAFREDIEEQLQELEKELARRDSEGLSRAAHNVKGMSVNLGAWRLEELAAEIEALAAAGKIKEIVPLVPLLREAILVVKAVLIDANWQNTYAMTENWRLRGKFEQKMEDLERLVSERTCQLQRTEKLYRGAIAGAGAIPYALSHKSQNYIFMGGRIKQLIGYAPEEMKGEIWAQIVQESVMLGEAAGLTRLEAREQAQEGKIRNWRCDMRVLTRSGETRWMSDASVVELDEYGRPISCMGILQDITERRTLEQRFLRAQRMENIGTLAGGIAHDINNVLTPIIMAAGLLQKKGQDEESHHLLSTIESSAQRGADMVRQILSFARGGDGDRERVCLTDLLRDIEKIGNDTFLKNVEFRSSISPGLWPVLGDATQLHQVLLNLCVNARDSMPQGGTLTLSAENVRLNRIAPRQNPDAKPGPYTVCTIKDTGTGIPPEALDKIFEPFFTTKGRLKGTGLGLSTSLSIVKSHGGFITIYSVPGSGSEFSVYLPATDDLNIEETPPSAVSPAASPLRGNGELVLVVDDEKHVRQMTQYVLESLGYRVALAPDGDHALSIYSDRQTEIDVLLTDIRMPGMDGAELIQAVLNVNPHARIIASSGVHASAEKFESLNPSAAYFLPKPYPVEALAQALLTVLSEREPMCHSVG